MQDEWGALIELQSQAAEIREQAKKHELSEKKRIYLNELQSSINMKEAEKLKIKEAREIDARDRIL